MKIIKQSLLFGSGFAGGLLAGAFIATGKNSKWVRAFRKKTGESFSNIKAAGQRAFAQGNKSVREFHSRLKKEVIHPIPDLYKATESFSMDEDDVIWLP